MMMIGCCTIANKENMRALVITEELLEAAWKFTVKSAPAMGTVPPENSCVPEKPKITKFSFHRKVKITISVCVGMFFCTLMLLFVLCAVEEPGLKVVVGSSGSIPRKWRSLQRKIHTGKMINGGEVAPPPLTRARALHGMGVVFGERNFNFNFNFSRKRRRRSMNELIVAHTTEGVTDSELSMFLRTLYRSGALARADLVILLPNNSLTERAFSVIEDECDMGYKKLSSCLSSTDACSSNSVSQFNAGAFREAAAAEESKPGGKRGDHGVGSITVFEMEELDPYNMLQGFIDDPPAQLRRWVCYPLLLGMLRHRYRTVLLARIGAVFILGDALASTRKKANAGLLLLMESRTWDLPYTTAEFYNATKGQVYPLRHCRRAQKPQPKVRTPRSGKMLLEGVYGEELWSSLGDEERQRRLISSGIMAGTVSSVRALANAMVNEIVRVSALEERKRWGRPFPDQVVLSYLVHMSSVLGRKVTDNLQLLDNDRRPPTLAYTVAGTNRTLADVLSDAQSTGGAIDGLSEEGRSASFADIVRRDLCSFPDEANVYRDCMHSTA